MKHGRKGGHKASKLRASLISQTFLKKRILQISFLPPFSAFPVFFLFKTQCPLSIQVQLGTIPSNVCKPAIFTHPSTPDDVGPGDDGQPASESFCSFATPGHHRGLGHGGYSLCRWVFLGNFYRSKWRMTGLPP